MMSKEPQVIYWFRQDLRVHDNLALNRAHAAGQKVLHIVHGLPSHPTHWGFERVSAHRQQFRAQATMSLQSILNKYGQTLITSTEAIESSIIDLAKRHHIQHVFCESLETPEELLSVQTLKDAGLNVHTISQSSLFLDHELPFTVCQTPNIFTVFRQKIEQNNIHPSSCEPPLFDLNNQTDQQLFFNVSLDGRASFPFNQIAWQGGEVAALSHLDRYFASDLPQHYKTTRHDLTGINYSTKFSPWLAQGALSPRLVWERLKQHEGNFGANDSTYWVGFELLWREHFRLMMRRHRATLFRKQGLLNTEEKTHQVASDLHHHDTQTRQLYAWRQGETGQSFIDAAMHELQTTGFLSNRLRQIVASFAIHDLGIDWRAGAAWFEHCLIDYDVHSNHGNWAYIAGVGTDPRGGRKFNVNKQIQQYDPDGHYQSLWKHP